MPLQRGRFTGSTSEEYTRWQHRNDKKRYGVVMHSGGDGYVVRQLEDDKDVFRDALYRDKEPHGGKTWEGSGGIPKNAEKYADKLNKER